MQQLMQVDQPGDEIQAIETMQDSVCGEESGSTEIGVNKLRNDFDSVPFVNNGRGRESIY